MSTEHACLTSCAGLSAIVGGPPPPDSPTKRDRLLGQIVLFVIFLSISGVIMLFFATVPIYSAHSYRNTTGWLEACEAGDLEALRAWGIS